MSNKGWIKIDRQILENFLWQERPFDRAHAWIDLLLMVNHETKKLVVDGKPITVERGQTLTSVRKLAHRWGWSDNKVRRFLQMASEENMIRCSTRFSDGIANGTAITVVKYGVFQDDRRANETPYGRADGRADGRQTRMIKNDKECKEEREVKRTRFDPPTLESVTSYFWEIGCGSDPRQFIDYYAARGWKLASGVQMADWKAAARSWKRRDDEKTKQQANRWGNDPDQRKEYGGEIDWGY